MVHPNQLSFLWVGLPICSFHGKLLSSGIHRRWKANSERLRNDIGQEVVTAYIGAEKAPFIVNKDLLTKTSPYFKATFEGQFKESGDRNIPIPGVTTTQFKLFLDWLYFGSLPKGMEPVGFGSTNCKNCTSTGPIAKNVVEMLDSPKTTGRTRVAKTSSMLKRYPPKLINAWRT